MNKYKLGEFIRYYRKKQKVSQADLCRNLCSVATMSRIENGETDTPVMMAQTLLERLGLNVNKFELLLDRDDSRYFRRRDEVRPSGKRMFFWPKKNWLPTKAWWMMINCISST